MVRKLPAGVAGPCDSAERTAPATTPSGLLLYYHLERARWARQGHARSASHREQPWQQSEGYFVPSGWRSPSSLRPATRCLTLPVRTGGSLQRAGSRTCLPPAILPEIESRPSGSQDAIRETSADLNNQSAARESSLRPAGRRRIRFWRHTAL